MLEGLVGGLKLVGMGAALAIGFWGAKKLTDRVDVFITTHSKEYRQLVEEMAKKEENANEPRKTESNSSSPSLS